MSNETMRAEFETEFPCHEYVAWDEGVDAYHAVNDSFEAMERADKQQARWEAWKAARAQSEEPVPSGWKLVPADPTDEMLRRGTWSGNGDVGVDEEWARKVVYRRMLAAAPQPPEQGWTPCSENRCPECGSVHLFWRCIQQNKGEALDGRLRLNEVGTLFVLGCEVCSETIETLTGDEMAERLAPEPPEE